MWESDIPFLFQLPSAWLVVVLSELLDMPSIGMLDTAVSSKKHRSQFLSSLQAMRSTSIDKVCGGHLKRCHYMLASSQWMGCWWRWLSIRQIHIENNVLRSDAVRSDLIIPSMQKIATDSFENDDFYYLVRNCPSLRSVHIFDFSENMSHDGLRFLTDLRQSLEDISLNWSNSEYLFVEEEREALNAVVIDILRQCTHLNKVSLAGFILNIVDLEKLHPYSHLLNDLHFEFEEEMMTSAYGQAFSILFSNCNNLRELHYDGNYDEQDSLAVSTLHQCRLLENLKLLSLSLSKQGQLGNEVEFFTRIGRSCIHLRKLHLSCIDLTEANLRGIAAMEALKDLALLDCGGLTVSSVAALAVMKLVKLCIDNPQVYGGLPVANMQSIVGSFVGSNISQTLESFSVKILDHTIPPDDIQVATALASCHQLKSLAVRNLCRATGCVFGRNGLAGLKAMATGCPLLADITLDLTVSGVHYVGTHFANLMKCTVTTYNSKERVSFVPAGTPSVKELQTLYPAVEWV